jgi:rhamnulokinase
MLQAKAMGVVHSLDEIREVIRNSFEITEYIPSPELEWDTAYARFEKLHE